MIDIEHGPLRAFEHDGLALRDGFVQQERGIGNEGSNLFRGLRVLGVHAVGIERLGIEERVRDHIFFAASVLDGRTQQL